MRGPHSRSLNTLRYYLDRMNSPRVTISYCDDPDSIKSVADQKDEPLPGYFTLDFNVGGAPPHNIKKIVCALLIAKRSRFLSNHAWLACECARTCLANPQDAGFRDGRLASFHSAKSGCLVLRLAEAAILRYLRDALSTVSQIE